MKLIHVFSLNELYLAATEQISSSGLKLKSLFMLCLNYWIDILTKIPYEISIKGNCCISIDCDISLPWNITGHTPKSMEWTKFCVRVISVSQRFNAVFLKLSTGQGGRRATFARNRKIKTICWNEGCSLPLTLPVYLHFSHNTDNNTCVL